MSFNLSTLNGTTGVRFDGEVTKNVAGYTVAGAGDVNGDGFDDIIIGAEGTNNAQGASYLVFGKAAGWTSSIALSSLDGTSGFRITGGAADALLSNSVASAGDINGDGYADLIIGAPGPLGNNAQLQGASYVVFGKATGWTANLDVATLNGTNGFSLTGATASNTAGDRFGVSAASAGDVNGDGLSDLIVGAYYADPNGDKSGSSYVIFGKSSAWAPSLNVTDLNGGNGFRLDGSAAIDQSGWSVASAGDANGDGYADILVGAIASSIGGTSSGTTYLVYGGAAGFPASLNLSSLNGPNGYRIVGGPAGDFLGWQVSSAGDVNGDGLDDQLIAARFTSSNGNTNAGAAYVIFGHAADNVAQVDAATLNGTNGFRLDGGELQDQSGISVSAAGDLNGDGFDDILVGRPFADPNGSFNAGAAYVVYGKAGGWAATLSLATLDGTNGVRLNGVYGVANGSNAALTQAGPDRTGESVAAAGDVNGDGQPDIIIGADGADPNGQREAGSAYLVFGNALTTTAGIQLHGTVNADAMLGAATNDTLDGRFGDDVLTGGAGNDSLLGGAGNDTLDGGAGNDTIDGGAGIDTVTYSAFLGGFISVNLSLTTSQNTSSAGSDTLRNVENLIGTQYSDVLTGSAGNNAIQGGAGNDQINGQDGNDTIDGGAGNDILNGGNGIDTLTYASAPGAISLNLSLTIAQATGGSGSDTVSNFEVVIGSAFNDTFWSSAISPTLNGGAGDDVFYGNGQAGTFIGGLGNDQFVIDKLGTVLVENAGEGIDTAWVAVNGYTVSANIEITRLTGGASGVTGSGDDEQLVANTAVASTIDGGGGNDVLWGSALDNALNGGAGDDIIRAQGGAGTFTGGLGNDTFVVDKLGTVLVENVNEGIDTAYVTVNGYTVGANVEISRLALNATSITGSASDEQIVANPLFASTLDGGAGDDVLWGSGFADSLVGGTGDDIFRGQLGADTMVGGLGNDQYVVLNAGVVILENAGEGYDTIWYAVSGQTMASNTERANLSGTAISVTGNTGNNLIVGNPLLGNTLLAGGLGSDTIFGGADADVFRGDAGNDVMTSGGGADRFIYQTQNWGQDQIAGFVQGQAKIDFTGSGIGFSQLTLSTFFDGGSVRSVAAFGTSNIFVFDVALVQSDFIFG